jgi:CrcB protein
LLGHFSRSWIPWPIVVVNILGAFLIGVCVKHWEQNSGDTLFRAFWIIGLCGGFTTFSTFGLEVVNFIKSAQWLNAFVYISLNFLGTLLAIFLGFRLYGWINS